MVEEPSGKRTYRRRLPHYQVEGRTLFITFRSAGSCEDQVERMQMNVFAGQMTRASAPESRRDQRGESPLAGEARSR